MPVGCQLARKARLYEAQSSSGTYTFSVPSNSTVHVPPRIVQHGDVSASLCHLTAFASSLAAAGIDACGMASLPVSRQPIKNFARVLTADSMQAISRGRGQFHSRKGDLAPVKRTGASIRYCELQPRRLAAGPSADNVLVIRCSFVLEVRSVISVESPAPSTRR